MRKPLLLSVPLLAVFLWQGGALTTAHPDQDAGDHHFITTQYTEVPILEILADLSHRGGLSYSVASGVPNTAVSAVFQDVDVNSAAQAVLEAAGLSASTVSRAGNGTTVIAVRSRGVVLDPHTAELQAHLRMITTELKIAEAENAIAKARYEMLEFEIKIAELEGWMEEEWGHDEEWNDWLEELGDETVQWLEEIGFFGEDDNWMEDLNEEEWDWLEELGVFEGWDDWDDDDDWEDDEEEDD